MMYVAIKFEFQKYENTSFRTTQDKMPTKIIYILNKAAVLKLAVNKMSLNTRE